MKERDKEPERMRGRLGLGQGGEEGGRAVQAWSWWDIHSLGWEMARPSFSVARVKGGCIVKGSDEVGLRCCCTEGGWLLLGATAKGGEDGLCRRSIRPARRWGDHGA